MYSPTTCCGEAPSDAVASQGMHVSFATKPNALAPAANVMTRCRLDLSSVLQSLASLILSCSRGVAVQVECERANFEKTRISHYRFKG